MSVENLPPINASLNAVAGLLLLGGWWVIKVKKRPDLHRVFMGAALLCSAAFLICYLYYHYNAGVMTKFERPGIVRYIYYVILATHVPLAALIVPFIFGAVWFAVKKQYDRHVKIVRWLWPAWMYVSVTGVIIYVMLYHMQ
jgi:putative membrane protein